MQSVTSYSETIHNIRTRLRDMNVQLSTYKSDESMNCNDTAGVDIKNLALYHRSQTKSTHSKASLNEFSLHWETMTHTQQLSHLNEYVDCIYAVREDVQPDELEAIRTFLNDQIVHTHKGRGKVTWNGYFIEHIPEVTWTKDDTHIAVSFVKCTQDELVKKKRKQTGPKEISFKTLRNKVQREKDNCYVNDAWLEDGAD